MAANFLKIQNGINFKGQSGAPSSPDNGDEYYDTSRNTHVKRINGNWSDTQSRSDVASSASLTSANFTASVTQSSLARITGSTTGNIHGLTASSDAKYIVLYNQSTAVMTLKNQSATEGTAANRIITATGADIQLLAGQSVTLTYDSSQSRWIMVGATGTGSGTGSGKNYLSAITTSQSSTPNTGNGNFELGSTTGWSLAHSTLSSVTPTSVASAGTPFDSTHGGSAANGNMSLTVNSSGVLQGTYAGHLSSSSASTAGDLLISNSFNIDSEDQAKVLTFKFYYNWSNGTGNFSGTSSNTWAVWIYDVTNGAWIQPAGVYGMTQSSGNGYCTGTFQTTTNGTAYQIALININATPGVYDLYVDDFSVGPQTAPIGMPATDATAYTPTYSAGFGTVTNNQAFWARRGDRMRVWGSTTVGTVTGTNLTVSLPSGYSVDTNKVPSSATANSYVGRFIQSNSTTNSIKAGDIVVAGSGTVMSWSFDEYALGLNPFNAQAGTDLTSSSVVSWWAEFPITGWSSNVQMSNDTDTRVVAATYYASANTTPGTNTQINFDTKIIDTHAAVTTGAGAWKFTAPVSGFYQAEVAIQVGSATSNSNVWYKNGSAYYTLGQSSATGTYNTNSTIFQLNAGDFIDVRTNSGVTINGGTIPSVNGTTIISISRLTGPSVVAATESVNMGYTDTAGSAIGTSFGTYTFATKVYDSHNAYSGGTYTVPISGKYRVYAALTTATTTITTSTALQIIIRQNGAQKAEWTQPGSGASTNTTAAIGVTLNCNAGDTIDIQVRDTNTSTTAITNSGFNNLNIERVGN